MALDQSALLEVLDALRNADAADRITQAAETIYQALIDAELTAVIGTGPYERSQSRTNQRNGSQPRTLSKRLFRRRLRPHAVARGAAVSSHNGAIRRSLTYALRRSALG
jgi:Transposase, Mutator family